MIPECREIAKNVHSPSTKEKEQKEETSEIRQKREREREFFSLDGKGNESRETMSRQENTPGITTRFRREKHKR
jgi:predicted nucleotidyltransferase